LIDSSVLIAVERGELDLEQKLSEAVTTELALASITASELLHGVHRAEREARRSLREAWVETLLSNFPVLSFDLLAARIHARLSAELASKGEPVGAHDLVIAATALSRGLDVITRDQRSFPRIRGLATVVW
jgi:predicted nucleic acid-binding protein